MVERVSGEVGVRFETGNVFLDVFGTVQNSHCRVRYFAQVQSLLNLRFVNKSLVDESSNLNLNSHLEKRLSKLCY